MSFIVCLCMSPNVGENVHKMTVNDANFQVNYSSNFHFKARQFKIAYFSWKICKEILDGSEGYYWHCFVFIITTEKQLQKNTEWRQTHYILAVQCHPARRLSEISLNPTALLTPASVCAEVESAMILQKISQAVPVQQTCNMLLISSYI